MTDRVKLFLVVFIGVFAIMFFSRFASSEELSAAQQLTDAIYGKDNKAVEFLDHFNSTVCVGNPEPFKSHSRFAKLSTDDALFNLVSYYDEYTMTEINERRATCRMLFAETSVDYRMFLAYVSAKTNKGEFVHVVAVTLGDEGVATDYSYIGQLHPNDELSH